MFCGGALVGEDQFLAGRLAFAACSSMVVLGPDKPIPISTGREGDRHGLKFGTDLTGSSGTVIAMKELKRLKPCSMVFSHSKSSSTRGESMIRLRRAV